MYLYLLRAEGTDLHKIGITANLDSRIRTISTSCPYRIQMLACYEFYSQQKASERERYWHKHFAAKRANREWFRLTGEDVKEIDRTENPPAPVKVYMAGRIASQDWREVLVPSLRTAMTCAVTEGDRDYPSDDRMACMADNEKWMPLVGGTIGQHTYMGPFFAYDPNGDETAEFNHGFREDWSFGISKHGVVANIYHHNYDANKLRSSVFYADLGAIDACECVFALIYDCECYGTLFELGYAYARKKPVYVAIDQRCYDDVCQSLWFSLEAVQYGAPVKVANNAELKRHFLHAMMHQQNHRKY